MIFGFLSLKRILLTIKRILSIYLFAIIEFIVDE